MNPEDYLDSRTFDHMDGRDSDHEEADGIVFVVALGVWIWFCLYHFTLWMLS